MGRQEGFCSRDLKLIPTVSMYTVLAVMSAIHSLRTECIPTAHILGGIISRLDAKLIPASVMMTMIIITSICLAFIFRKVLLGLITNNSFTSFNHQEKDIFLFLFYLKIKTKKLRIFPSSLNHYMAEPEFMQRSVRHPSPS